VGEASLTGSVDVALKDNIRLMGRTFTVLLHPAKPLCHVLHAHNERGSVALTSQSGGVGCDHRLQSLKQDGVSAIIGLGNKSDIDEDDLPRSR
jgi:succinyl-CoA synthetase alpha subunit